MSFQRNELGRGIYFSAAKTDKFKSGLISVRFILPLSQKTAAENALLFPVLLRGSKAFPNMESIRKEEESIYDTHLSDSVYKRGDTQILEMRMNLLDNRFAIDGMDILSRALDLLEDILFHPVTENGAFSEEYTESEKEKLILDIEAQINDKRRYAATRLVEEMFEDDPFGISELGTAESVAAVTPESLYKQYLNLLSTARIEIFAVGGFEAEALKARFEAMLAGLSRDHHDIPETRVPAAAKSEVKTVYERQSISQGRLSLGFYTGKVASDPDFTVMQMANAVFGAGTVSKLFMNVREKLSLCYDCHSALGAQKGVMFVHTGIKPENEKKAADEILYQLDEMKKGNITEDELLGARLALIDATRRVYDSVGALLNWYFSGVMNGRVISPEEKRREIEGVSAEMISGVMQGVTLDTYYFLTREEEA